MEVEKVIQELETVYEDRQQYSINWAFREAQHKVSEFFDEGTKKQQDVMSRNKWYSRIFQTSLHFLSVVEFLISVLLVLFVSSLSHAGSEIVSTRMFSASVILVFAFIKVFLEQYLIRPKVEEFGWRIYQRIIALVKEFM